MRSIVLFVCTLVLAACGGAEDGSSAAPFTSDPGASGAEQIPDEGEPEASAVEPDGRLVVGDDPCDTDADCVPADCCHAAACVARDRAPDCGDVMCTMECRADTMDCGGGCLCHEGRCAARLADLEAPTVQ